MVSEKKFWKDSRGKWIDKEQNIDLNRVGAQPIVVQDEVLIESRFEPSAGCNAAVYRPLFKYSGCISQC